MKKFVRSLLVASCFAAGAGALIVSTPTDAIGQVTKEKAKPADPKAPPAAAKGSVVIKPGKDGKFRFFVRDEDDKSLMQSSTGYATEDEAKKMLDNVKAILAASKVTSEKAEK